MEKNTKILVGVVVGLAVIAAAYFGAGGGAFQGKLISKDRASSNLNVALCSSAWTKVRVSTKKDPALRRGLFNHK